jgi:hypothetical protein
VFAHALEISRAATLVNRTRSSVCFPACAARFGLVKGGFFGGAVELMADPIATRTKEEDAAIARVGSTIRGKWQLDSLLGVGGVAAVFAATHRNGQRAALKVMHVELARDRSIVERFLREAYVANKVGHPACVRVIDDDTTESDEPFLVMELLEGETVRDYWRRTGKTIPVSQALHIAERILDCLAACHAVGVVHRDLKPANIFMMRSGAIKLLDFGVAREEGARHEGDKTLGLALGTPAYMSPEQANGRVDRIDGRSDLFSVGALLHALITGRRIHRGRTEKESLHLAATQPVPSVATVDPTLPAELVRLIDKALAWEPERRWSNAREMQSVVLSAMRVATDERRAAAEGEGEAEDAELTPVHEVVARDDARVREIESILATWDDALVSGLLQGFESSNAEPAMRRAFDACGEVQRRRNAVISLVVRPFGFAAFDHVLWQPKGALAAIPHRLFEGGVRAIRVLPGITFAELRTLLAIVATPGDVDVVGGLWEAALPHVRVDTCVVCHLGDIAAREAFATESLKDESEAAHRVHAAREAGAAWTDEASPLAPDDTIRAVYASQLSVDRWDERYAELYTEGLIQGARTRSVGPMLSALRKVATELYTQRRYEDARSLRLALVERLGQRVGPKDAPKLAGAVTSAMLGKEALDALLRSLAQNPADLPRASSQLDDVPAAEAPTVIAASSRPMPLEVQRAVSALVARTAGPAEAEALGDRPSAIPTARSELAPDAILARDARAERHARIVSSLAAVLEAQSGHDDSIVALATELAAETADKPFEIFFGESATFVCGRMLYAERAVHDAAASIAALFARCGAHAFVCNAAPSAEQVRAFAAAIAAALDRAAPLPSAGPLALRALTQAARTRGVAMERLSIEPRVMRVHASAVAALRAHREPSTDVPRAVAHVARSIADVASAPPWLLAAVTEPDLAADEISLAVSAAMLATAMARLLVEDRAQLVRVALAALTAPTSRGDDALQRAAVLLASQTSGSRTALARAVVAFETTWLSRVERDGSLYRGARAPTLHTRIVSTARTYLALLADRTPPPPTPERLVAALSQRANDTAERTVLRLLVATLGFIPAGTVARLSSGETAEVIASNRGTGRGPVARLVLDENGEEYSEPFEVELAVSGDEGLRIEKVMSVDQWRKGESAPIPRAPVHRRTPPPPAVEPAPAARPPSDPLEPEQVSVSGARPASAIAALNPSPSPPPTSQRPPSATGTLATTPLVNTLVYMLDHGLSGTIELREPDGTRHELYFLRGAAVRARTGRIIAPLGELLVTAGFLRQSDAPAAIEAAKTQGVRLGQHLVGRDLVARVDLMRTLEIQIVRKIERIVNFDPQTTFAFYRDVDFIEGDSSSENVEVDPLGTVFAAARAWQDRARVRRVVERASQLLLAIHPDSALELVDLTPDERTVLAELRTQPSHFVELVTRSSAMPDAIDTFLFVALVTRQLLVPGQAKPPMGMRPMPVHRPSPFPQSAPPARQSFEPPPPSKPKLDSPIPSPPPSNPSPPTSVRSPGQKKISWSDLLAVRRPSQSSMRSPSLSPQPGSVSAPPTSKRSPTPVATPKPKPKQVTLSASATEAVALMRRGEQALVHKDIAGAKRLAGKARAQDGSVPIVNAFAAWVAVLAGDSTAADGIAQLDKIIVLDDACIPARLYRAKLLKRENRMPESMRELEVVLQLEPDNRDAQNEMKLLMLTAKSPR